MRLYVVAVCLALVAVACGTEAPAKITPSAGKAEVSLPEQVLGLEVVEEDIGSEVKKVSGAYLDSVGLFSFRETDDLLRATLQVGRFNDVAEPRRKRFRDSIISQLGSTVPTPLRAGDDLVYLTAGSDQSIYTWFVGDGFFVLSVRRDYPFPRSLLRRMLDGARVS